MGQFRRTIPARAGVVVLILVAVLDARAAHADDCVCANVAPSSVNTTSASSSSGETASPLAAPARQDIKKPGTVSTKFVNGKRNYDLRLLGSAANTQINPDSLKAGETSRKYVGIELGGKLGSIVQTDLQVRFTEAQDDTGKAMFDLQPVNQNGDARRALQDFFTSSSLFGERLTLSSYERSSTFAVLDATGVNTKGELEQHHMTAALWHSDRADLDLDAGLSRTSSNYWDFGDSPDADLHANNSQISQYRSKFRLDRFGVSVTHRDTATLVAPIAGEIAPSRSETEAKLSVNVADWRDDLGLAAAYRALIPLPDSIWVGTTNGAFSTSDAALMLHQAVNKISLGASRNFDFGTVTASYWQSVTEPTRDTPAAYRGAGHGVDLGSNLKFGTWGITGNVSLANNQNFSAGTGDELDTFGCAVFLTWQAPLRVDIKAGVTTNFFQNEFIDYGQLEKNDSFRYQLALDLSRLASASLPQRDIQVKLLASFQGNQNRSQTNTLASTADMFTGLQLAIPIHP